jgi:ribonuclease HI
MPEQPHIEIYTDGGASPNPGPGGWGAILIHPKKTLELSGGHPDTTNNRMELTAAVEALRVLNSPCTIDFYTDSQYLRNGITKWINGWKANNWHKGKSGKGDPVLNADLWRELDQLIQMHTINWQWVKGHAGNEYNERADQLASAAIPHPEVATNTDAAQVYLRISGKAARGPYGWVARVERGEETMTITGGHPNTTANHFTLYAAVATLAQLPTDEPVQFHTNNSYLYDGITRWVAGWKRKDWAKPDKFRTEWQMLDRLNEARQIQWVRFKNENEPEAFAALKDMVEAARDDAAAMPAAIPLETYLKQM